MVVRLLLLLNIRVLIMVIIVYPTPCNEGEDPSGFAKPDTYNIINTCGDGPTGGSTGNLFPGGSISGGHNNGGGGPTTITTYCSPRNCPSVDEPAVDTPEYIELLNETYSNLSPFDVDISEQLKDTLNVAENEKFVCIYNKLINSPKFKDLFIDTFGESQNLNVKFEITNEISVNGRCKTTNISVNPTTGEIVEANMIIQLNKNYVNQKSSIAIAKTIIHEAIHAYLNIKQYGCNQGTSFQQLDDMQLSEILTVYQ